MMKANTDKKNTSPSGAPEGSLCEALRGRLEEIKKLKQDFDHLLDNCNSENIKKAKTLRQHLEKKMEELRSMLPKYRIEKLKVTIQGNAPVKEKLKAIQSLRDIDIHKSGEVLVDSFNVDQPTDVLVSILIVLAEALYSLSYSINQKAEKRLAAYFREVYHVPYEVLETMYTLNCTNISPSRAFIFRRKDIKAYQEDYLRMMRNEKCYNNLANDARELTVFGAAVKPFLIRLLEKELNIGRVLETCYTLQIPGLMVIRALLQNPHLYSSEMIRKLAEYLRFEEPKLFFWPFPSLLRRKLLKEFSKYLLPHHPFHEFDDLNRLVQKHGVWPFLSIFRLLRMPGEATPWNYYALSSLEELSGLQVKQQVDVEESDELRFHYLFSECCPRSLDVEIESSDRDYQKHWEDYFERPKGDRGRPFTCDELEQLEREIDGLRDHLDQRIKELEDEFDKLQNEEKDQAGELQERLRKWLHSLRNLRPEGSSASFPDIPLPESLRNKIEDIDTILHGKDKEGGLLQKVEEKNKISDDIYRDLKEKGLKCRRIVIEGVLGCYSFNARLITLYPRMMKLVLPDLIPVFTSQKRYDLNEIFRQWFSALQTIVEIHESAHTTWHLGEDKNGAAWKSPADFSSELHETIAQYYTHLMIEQIPSPENHLIRDMFNSLNKRQTFRYQLFRELNDIQPETVRSFFLKMRRGDYSKLTYEGLWGHILKIIASCYDFLEKNMPQSTLTVIQDQTMHVLKGEVPLETALKFIDQLQSIRPMSEMIQMSLGRLLPDREELILLYLEQIYLNGRRNGDTSRFTLEAAKGAEKLAKPNVHHEILNHPIVCRLHDILLRRKESSNSMKRSQRRVKMD